MRQHRALRFAAGFLLITACAGYTVWWRSSADRIRTQSTAWIDARRAEGWTVEAGTLSVGGFPFGWRLDAGTIKLARPDGTRADASNVTARANLWSPRRVRVEGDAINATLPAGTNRAAVALTAAHGEASVADAIELVLQLPNWRSGDAAPVAARSAKFSWRERNATLSLAELHPAVQSPLGDTIQSLDLAVTAEPAMPQGADAASLQRWREQSGVLQLNKVALQWGALSLNGEGTAALDAQGRIELAGTARLTGWSETVDALVAAGSVKPNGGALAKAALGMLAKPKDGAPKEKSEVQVAVAVQDGQLYLGGIRLGPAPLPRAY